MRATRFSAAVHRLLHQESVERWADGWALAERIGPPVAAALRAAWRSETNRANRWVLIGAVAAASRDADADAWLSEIATAKARSVDDAALALLCLAVRPMRSVPAPAIEQLALEERAGSILAVAAALASARFVIPAVGGRGEGSNTRGSSAIGEQVASAVRGTLSVEALHRALDTVRGERASMQEGLILRAAFLGRDGKIADDLLNAARDLVQHPATPRDVRVAAALHLGRAGVRLDDLVVRDPHARAALAAFPRALQELRAKGLLGPTPEVLIDERTRLPLVAGYALATPWPTIVAEWELWSREPVLVDAVALALAWRAMVDQPPAAAVSRLAAALQARPAGLWFDWATGGVVDRTRLGSLDARGARIAALALDKHIDQASVAREIEDALWRGGAHPSLVWHAAWNDLLLDALLAGSNHVHARLQRDERLPLPRGIESSSDKFFLIADRLFRFLTERVPAPPPELRLSR